MLSGSREIHVALLPVPLIMLAGSTWHGLENFQWFALHLLGGMPIDPDLQDRQARWDAKPRASMRRLNRACLRSMISQASGILNTTSRT